MSNFLVRDIDQDVMRRLKERARRNGRSLQQEVHEALERAVQPSPDEMKRIFEEFDAKHPILPSNIDVVEILRDERDNYGWK